MFLTLAGKYLALFMAGFSSLARALLKFNWGLYLFL